MAEQMWIQITDWWKMDPDQKGDMMDVHGYYDTPADLDADTPHPQYAGYDICLATSVRIWKLGVVGSDGRPQWIWDGDAPKEKEGEKEMKKHYLEDAYGCRVHRFGRDPEEYRCSCRSYWAEDVSPLSWRDDHEEGVCAANGGACATKMSTVT